MSEQPRVPAAPSPNPHGGEWASAKTSGASGAISSRGTFGAEPVKSVYNIDNRIPIQGHLPGTRPSPEVAAEYYASMGKRFLNRHLTSESIAKMAGAPPGASVLIEEYGAGGRFTVTSRTKEGYYSQRNIDLRSKVITNEESKVPEEMRGSGAGTKILVRQVEEARAMGMLRIETYAAGTGSREKGKGKSGIYNGYYSWLRMGFMPVDKRGYPKQTLMTTEGHKVNLFKMMSTKIGRDYWRDHGSSFDGVFDLNPKSISSRVLSAYAKEQGL